MFNRIVVPLDGTPFAETALAPACELARAFGSRLVVVRAVAPSGLPRVVVSDDSQSAFEQVDDADAYLHGVVEKLRAAGFDANIVLYIAEAGTAIARTAEVDHADLIVMTAHPRWRSDLLDNTSTTLQVLARSRIPILAWRLGPQAARSRETDLAQEHVILASADTPILVPLDGSHHAEAALPIAETLARTFGAYLVLARAYEHEARMLAPLPVDSTTSADAAPAARDTDAYLATAYLKRIQAEIMDRGLGATVIVHQGTPATVIEAAWREHNAGIVVMASHGTTGTATAFLGSVAARAIEQIGAPVLVVRPHTATVRNEQEAHVSDASTAHTAD